MLLGLSILLKISKTNKGVGSLFLAAILEGASSIFSPFYVLNLQISVQGKDYDAPAYTYLYE